MLTAKEKKNNILLVQKQEIHNVSSRKTQLLFHFLLSLINTKQRVWDVGYITSVDIDFSND